MIVIQMMTMNSMRLKKFKVIKKISRLRNRSRDSLKPETLLKTYLKMRKLLSLT